MNTNSAIMWDTFKNDMVVSRSQKKIIFSFKDSSTSLRLEEIREERRTLVCPIRYCSGSRVVRDSRIALAACSGVMVGETPLAFSILYLSRMGG